MISLGPESAGGTTEKAVETEAQLPWCRLRPSPEPRRPHSAASVTQLHSGAMEAEGGKRRPVPGSTAGGGGGTDGEEQAVTHELRTPSENAHPPSY